MVNFTELEVWKSARELNKSVYMLTDKFPIQEQFNLTQHIRKTSISISSNIAEGCGRNTFKDSANFIYIARGSVFELETQLYLAFDLGYINKEEFKKIEESLIKNKKLINGFINYHNSKLNNGSKYEKSNTKN